MTAAEVGANTASGSLRTALVVNTADRGGGAEGAARAIAHRFGELGTQTTLAVGRKRGAGTHVVAFGEADGDAVARRPCPQPTFSRAMRRRIQARLGLEDFDHPAT